MRKSQQGKVAATLAHRRRPNCDPHQQFSILERWSFALSLSNGQTDFDRLSLGGIFAIR
jgi:hypothetical protein